MVFLTFADGLQTVVHLYGLLPACCCDWRDQTAERLRCAGVRTPTAGRATLPPACRATVTICLLPRALREYACSLRHSCYHANSCQPVFGRAAAVALPACLLPATAMLCERHYLPMNDNTDDVVLFPGDLRPGGCLPGDVLPACCCRARVGVGVWATVRCSPPTHFVDGGSSDDALLLTTNVVPFPMLFCDIMPCSADVVFSTFFFYTGVDLNRQLPATLLPASAMRARYSMVHS